MTTAATSLLGLALPVTGELSGTWGDTVNNSITSLLDSAVAGTTTLSTDADVTLTTTTLAANQAREAIILWTAAGTVTRTITAPAQSKTYVVINKSSTQSIKLVGAGPTTGITVLPGESTYAAWNGSDFVKVGEYGGNLTVNSLTTTASTTGSTNNGPLNYGTLSFSDTGIVQSAQTSVNSYFQNVIQNTSAGAAASAEFIAYNDQGTASTNYATVGINSSGYTGTGSINAPGYAYFLSASTDLVLGTIGANGIHFTTNSSATDALAISSAGAVSLPGGTANGVAYLNGSNVLTTGTALVFDGTNLGLGVTPTYWSPSWKALQIGYSGSIAGHASVNVFTLSSNAYNDGSPRYIQNGLAAQYQMSSGVHAWFNATSGIANNAIGFFQAMTLDASGQLGIGNSSPAAKLDVTGTAAISGNVTLSGGTANGVAYLNGSKVVTTGSALTFDGTINLSLGTSAVFNTSAGRANFTINGSAGSIFEMGQGSARKAYIYTDGTDLSISNDVAGAQRYLINGSEQMRLNSTGLGIGTSSPQARLTIADASSANNGTIWLGSATYYGTLKHDASGTGANLYNVATASGGGHQFQRGGTTLMELNQNGNLGLGVTPSAWNAGNGALQIANGAAFGGLGGGYTVIGQNYYGAAGADKYIAAIPASRFFLYQNSFTWQQAGTGTVGGSISWTSAMTLDASGNLLVGQTSSGVVNSNGICIIGSAGGQAINHVNGTDSGSVYMYYGYNGSTIGSITQSGTTAVLYNTTSDQRLKENIVDAESSSALIDAIQVRQYDWKSDGSHQRYGFIAQELVTVAPEAVHQPADPEEMMAVDYSKLVPMLVKEIQDLRKRLAALEAK